MRHGGAGTTTGYAGTTTGYAGTTTGSAPGVERIRALMRRIGGRVLVLDDRLSPRAPPGPCRRIRSIRRLLAPAAPRLCHAPSLGIIRPAMLLVSFQPLTDLECSVHVELPVHALLPWPEVGGRPRHWDYLGPVDLVGVPIVNNGRRAFVEDVLQPIGVLTIREGDQEAVIMLDRDDGCLVCPARSSPHMADDRRVGSFLSRQTSTRAAAWLG